MRGTPLAGTFCTLFPQEQSALSSQKGTRFSFRAQAGREASPVFRSVHNGARYPRIAHAGRFAPELSP